MSLYRDTRARVLEGLAEVAAASGLPRPGCVRFYVRGTRTPDRKGRSPEDRRTGPLRGPWWLQTTGPEEVAGR